MTSVSNIPAAPFRHLPLGANEIGRLVNRGILDPVVDTSGHRRTFAWSEGDVADVALYLRWVATAIGRRCTAFGSTAAIAAALSLWRAAGRPAHGALGLRDGAPWWWATPHAVADDVAAGRAVVAIPTTDGGWTA